MAYTEFKALLKKINLKPKGVKEIVLEVSDGALHGKIDMLSEMLDGRVAVAIDSEIVRYNVQINARTEKPIKTYRVDARGVVEEVKSEGEQVEMDLGLPKREDPIAAIPEKISREVVDEFILSGLAPQPKGFYPLAAWIGRIADGETYLKIAGEEGLSSGRVVDLIDEYRQEVAPRAAKWDEWRQSKAEQSKPESDEDTEDEEQEDDSSAGERDVAGEPSDDEEIELEDGDEPGAVDPAGEVEKQHESALSEDELSDWEREIMGGQKSVQQSAAEDKPGRQTEPLDVESIILTEKPQFEDIPFDFPALLQRRKEGETWMQIASSLGITSSKLSIAWTKYKKRISDSKGGAA